MTRQRTIEPSISTSLTPDACSIARTGGVPKHLTSTRWIGCSVSMHGNLGSTGSAAIRGMTESVLTGGPRELYGRFVPRTVHRSGNLPAEATSFVGRRDELAKARRILTAGRLLSLVGPGGVGKTRLAIRIARGLGRGFPGGAWLVELAELRDPGLVGNAVLAALDLRDQAATEPQALLRSYLRDRELLLTLDNCEHLLDAAAVLVGDVLKTAPGVRVITTSREPLSVAGEQVLPIPPLQLLEWIEPGLFSFLTGASTADETPNWVWVPASLLWRAATS